MSPIPLGILAASGLGAAGAYDLLETQVLASDGSLEFTGLGSYSDYKHLQLRFVARSTSTNSAMLPLYIRLNSDSGSNYASHGIIGNGVSVTAVNDVSSTLMSVQESLAGNGNIAGIFGAGVVDILDFSNSSKNTTIRGVSGGYAATEQRISLSSGFWNNTAAVTTIGLVSNHVAGSRFSLYGVK